MKIESWVRTVLVAAMTMALLTPVLQATESGARVKARDSAITPSHDLERALEQARTTAKPIFVEFGAVWCPVCRHLEEATFLEPEVQQLAGDFIWVKIDIDRSETLAREWGVTALPTMFILDAGGNQLQKIVGGISAEELAKNLRQALVGPGGEETPGHGAVPTAEFPGTPLTVKPTGYRGHAICFSHVGYGPLNIRSQSPFQSLRLGILPRTPSTLARGDHELRVDATWANVWATDDGSPFDPSAGEFGRYFLDFESLDVDVEYSYGLSDTFQLDVGYEQRRHFGGLMDGFIQNFHNLIGIGQGGRDLVPRNQFHVFLDPGEGREPVVLDTSDRGTFARNFLLTLQHNITCGNNRWPALSWSLTTRWSPWQNDAFEGSNLDFAASIAAARRFGKVYAYLTVGYTYFGTNAVYDIPLDQTQLSVLAAAEWRFKPRMSLILQYLWTQGVAAEPQPFSASSNEVVIGWKGEITPGGVLELGLLENVITFDNSPDFGVHAGYTMRF